jgi:hypothetical protein
MEMETTEKAAMVRVPRRKMTEEEKNRLTFVVGEMDRLRHERDDLVAEFYTKGADYEEMAEAMGKTRNAAVMMIRNLRRSGVDVGPYRARGPRKTAEA